MCVEGERQNESCEEGRDEEVRKKHKRNGEKVRRRCRIMKNERSRQSRRRRKDKSMLRHIVQLKLMNNSLQTWILVSI